MDEEMKAAIRELGLDPDQLVLVDRVTIPCPSHDEIAALMLSRGQITAQCRETPCLPCDGQAKLGGCECSCHGKKV